MLFAGPLNPNCSAQALKRQEHHPFAKCMGFRGNIAKIVSVHDISGCCCSIAVSAASCSLSTPGFKVKASTENMRKPVKVRPRCSTRTNKAIIFLAEFEDIQTSHECEGNNSSLGVRQFMNSREYFCNDSCELRVIIARRTPAF